LTIKSKFYVGIAASWDPGNASFIFFALWGQDLQTGKINKNRKDIQRWWVDKWRHYTLHVRVKSRSRNLLDSSRFN
jgi:hypothetical protein